MAGTIAATRPIRRDMFKKPGRLIAALLLVALPLAFVLTFYTLDKSERSGYVEHHNLRFIFFNEPEMSTYPSEEEFRDILPPELNAEISATVSGNIYAENNQRSFTTLEQYPPSVLRADLPVVPRKGEIILAKSSAQGLQAKVGDTITFKENSEALGLPALELKVVGIAPGGSSLVGSGTLATAADFFGQDLTDSISWLAVNPSGENLSGPDIYVGQFSGQESVSTTAQEISYLVSVLAFQAVIALLILLFLAPAFSLALSRHTRMFALMASQGATRKHIAMAVLSFALLTGVIGATLGVAAGLVAGWATFIHLNPGWPVQIPWIEAGCLWMVAVAGCLMAASLPAYMAGRSSLSGAIAGKQPDKVVHWRKWMAIGPVMLTAGTVATAIYSFFFENEALKRIVPVGLVTLFALIAIALSAPAVIFGLNKITAGSAVALRTAGRGLARKSMHAAPAVAALLAMSFLLTVSSSGWATFEARSAKSDQLGIPNNVVFLFAEHKEAVENTKALIFPELGTAKEVPLMGISPSDLFGTKQNWSFIQSPDSAECANSGTSYEKELDQLLDPPVLDEKGHNPLLDEAAAKACLQALKSYYGQRAVLPLRTEFLIGGDELLDLVKFEDADSRNQAAETLREGGIVVPRGSGFTGMSEASFELIESSGSKAHSKASAVVPVSESMSPHSPELWLISKKAARALGANPMYLGAAVIYNNPISTHQADHVSRLYTQTIREKMNAATTPVTQDLDGQPGDLLAEPYVSSESRYQASQATTAAMIMIVLTLVTVALLTALSISGSRRQARTLHSLGAPHGLAARIAAYQTLLITAGSLLPGFLLGQLAVLATSSTDKFTAAGDLYRLGELGSYQVSWLILGAAVLATALSTGLTWAVHSYFNREELAANAQVRENRLLV